MLATYFRQFYRVQHRKIKAHRSEEYEIGYRKHLKSLKVILGPELFRVFHITVSIDLDG